MTSSLLKSTFITGCTQQAELIKVHPPISHTLTIRTHEDIHAFDRMVYVLYRIGLLQDGEFKRVFSEIEDRLNNYYDLTWL
jgi:hypothetical protein